MPPCYSHPSKSAQPHVGEASPSPPFWGCRAREKFHRSWEHCGPPPHTKSTPQVDDVVRIQPNLCHPTAPCGHGLLQPPQQEGGPGGPEVKDIFKVTWPPAAKSSSQPLNLQVRQGNDGGVCSVGGLQDSRQHSRVVLRGHNGPVTPTPGFSWTTQAGE